ncbi:MAG TPA: hypothetical protein VL096_02120 [Pirellulaceae bacterium]|nr:hypothetical protein [Pirellulaceae bacterium]
MSNSLNDSPNHPIIDRPHEYQIIRLDYHNDIADWRLSFLDLTLQRETTIRRLRFLRPQRLVIEEGFPVSTHGMQILDIRHRQWDGLSVEVINDEPISGAITFCAAEVIDLDGDGFQPE